MKRLLILLALLVLATASPAGAGVLVYNWRVLDSAADPSARIPQFFVCDTEAERPAALVADGDLAYTKDTDIMWSRSAGAWVDITTAGGGGAPTNAEYVTYAANATLSAERVLTSGTNTTVDLATVGQAKVNLSGTHADAFHTDSYSGVGACGASTFATTLNDTAAPTCSAIVDADVPNTITIDLATLATTATTANAGDSATAFFPAGTIEDARIDGSTEADELVLAGDVDGTANANDLDEANVEAELEAVIDLADLQEKDIDSLTGQSTWGTAATKETADLTVSGVEVDFEAGAAEGYPRLAQSATPPAGDCDAAGEAGRLYFDNDADTDGSVYICRGATGWKDIDDDGGGGSTPTGTGYRHVTAGVEDAAAVSPIPDADIPNTITIDLAAAATALAANPADCVDATHFSVGVLASGVAVCEAIADADVPNTITVDLAAAATALAANPADCVDATHFAVGVTAAGVATCEAIADADVPNTITVDLSTLATTANAGDSATAFFAAGTIEVARGGTGSAPAGDDQVLVSDSAAAATWRTVPNCTNNTTEKLNYDAATNAWECNTDQTGGGSTPTGTGFRHVTAGVEDAASVTVNLASISGHVTGTLPVTSGGTGVAGIGAAGDQLRVNLAETALEFFTPSSGAANAATTTVAITSVGTYFPVTLSGSGVSWVTAGMSVNCSPYAGGATTVTPETLAVAGLHVTVGSIVAGTSFDVLVNSPYGLEGTVEIRCIGV